jgi:hypothetical protein
MQARALPQKRGFAFSGWASQTIQSGITDLFFGRGEAILLQTQIDQAGYHGDAAADALR